MGKTTDQEFDENFRKTRTRLAPGTADDASTYFGYDAVGNLTSTTDPRGNPTTFAYDNRNRKTSVTDALNQTTSTVYDPVGNKQSEARPNGEVITYDSYDAMNRLTHKTVKRDATTSDVTSMIYDPAGNLQTNTDERGNLYTYVYDALNRLTSMVYPNGQHEDKSYDPAGNLATYTNRAGAVQTFVYDNRNRPTGFTWSDGTSPQTTAYDAGSRKTQIVNNDATINLTYYDDNTLHTQEEWSTVAALGDNVHRIVTYAYDGDGNRSSITYPSGTLFNYGYTNRNQLASIADASQHTVVGYTFDPSGNIITRTLDNGTSTSYTPDAVNRETSVVHNLSSGVRRFDYAYNSVNDITAVQRDSGNGDGYTYDLTQQILGYQQNGAVNLAAGTVTSPTANTSLEFDGCGNRTKLNGAPLATPNNMNQPTDAGIQYQNNGNLQTYNGWTYVYDAQNRLRSATSAQTVANFYYDGLNRQVARSIGPAGAPTPTPTPTPPPDPTPTPTATPNPTPTPTPPPWWENGPNPGSSRMTVVFSVWDGDWALLEEYDSSGNRLESYLQGYHGLVKTVVSNIYYYQDELGSTSHIASASGALLEYYKYDLYGKPQFFDALNSQLSTTNYSVRDLFAGQRFVTEIGLYDDRNRFMSPDLGRFLQPDPIGFKGDSSNLYRYCGNDWANRTDPMGLDTEFELQYVPVVNGNVHEYIFARDTVTHETLVSRAGPSEKWHKPVDAYFNRTEKATVNPGNQKGNIWLKADLTQPASKSGDVTKDSKTVPGSRTVLKQDLSDVKSKLQGYNDAVNAKKLDYQAKTTNSNAFANSEYNYITGHNAPFPPAPAPGANIDLTPMINRDAERDPSLAWYGHGLPGGTMSPAPYLNGP